MDNQNTLKRYFRDDENKKMSLAPAQDSYSH